MIRYMQDSEVLAPLAAEALLLFTSIRRSLFATPDLTMEYFQSIMNSLLRILQSSKHMDDQDCHSFIAQTLSKLKANLQLVEMVKFPRFSEFFQAVTQFVVHSIQSRG